MLGARLIHGTVWENRARASFPLLAHFGHAKPLQRCPVMRLDRKRLASADTLHGAEANTSRPRERTHRMREKPIYFYGCSWNVTISTVDAPRYGLWVTDFTMARGAAAYQ